MEASTNLLLSLAIALATVTIFIRCCFRVAELKDGFSSGLANNEAAFMVLEGPMLIIAVLALTVFHPGTVFGGADNWKATKTTNNKTEPSAELKERDNSWSA